MNCQVLLKQVEAALVVEARRDAELPRQQVDSVLNGKEVARERIAAVDDAGVDRDFARLNDAVAVRVGEVIRPQEQAVHREPDRVARAPGADRLVGIPRRVDAEREHLVAVVRGRDGHVPPEPARIDERGVDLRLVARVLHGAEVRANARRRRRRRRGDGERDQRVLRLLVVVGEVDVHAIAQHARLEPALELTRRLRLEVRVAERAFDQTWRVDVREVATVVAENVRSASVDPGCTPDWPYAERRRNGLTKLHFGKNASSDMIHERLAFG